MRKYHKDEEILYGLEGKREKGTSDSILDQRCESSVTYIAAGHMLMFVPISHLLLLDDFEGKRSASRCNCCSLEQDFERFRRQGKN